MKFKNIEMNDEDFATQVLEYFGPDGIKKNIYGVEAPTNGSPKTPGDWNANGLMDKVKAMKDVMKTLSVANVAAITPEFVMPELVDTSRRRSPFATLIQKVPLIGKKARRPYDNSNASISWGAGDGADLTPVDVNPTEVTANLAYTYLTGSIAYPARKVGETTVDIYTKRIEKYYHDYMRAKEEILFRGDPSGTSTVASRIDLSAAASSVQGILPALAAASKATDLAGARKITLGDAENIFETMEDAGAVPSLLLCDRSTYTILRRQASAALRIDPDTPRYGFGLNEFNIDGVNVTWSPGLSTTTGQRALVGIDFRAIAEHVSLPPEVVPVAQPRADRAEFFIRNYWTSTWITDWCYAYVDGK